MTYKATQIFPERKRGTVTKAFNYRMTPDAGEKLREMAKIEGVPKSVILEELICRHYEQRGGLPKNNSAVAAGWRRFLGMIG